ncbi:MAG: hypothetical protein ACI89D_000490 [Bermanella sp.]
MPAHYHWQQQTLLLHCHIQAGAKSQGVQGLQNGRLKIRLQAPAIDGCANAAFIDFLAQQFAVRKTDIQLLRGHGNRYKTLAISKPATLPPALEINPPSRSTE